MIPLELRMNMEDYKVIITTSGIGSRLGDLTKYTNKSLVRIGKKPALSYIIESYPKDITIVVTLGHYGDHVKNFIALAYPDRTFEYVDVDKFTGNGSSLLYSMLCAKDKLQCPFIFHAGDTIVTDSIRLDRNYNWVGTTKTKNSTQYRTVELFGTYLINIKEKGEKGCDRAHIGLINILDYESFWEGAQSIYNENPNDQTLSDCHTINWMRAKGVIFRNEDFSKWLDIGNMDSLNVARENIPDKFDLLDKADESISIFDEYVIKFFHNSEIAANRIKRANILEGIVPEIIDSKECFYKYRYANGTLLPDLIDPVIFRNLLEWCKFVLWVKVGCENSESREVFRCFYREKTYKRVAQYLGKTNDDEVKINGATIPSIYDLLEDNKIKALATGERFRIHGDLVLDNIIINDGNFTLLDWRQDFGGILEYGDIYYDFAKLQHNLIFNHQFIYRKLYEIKPQKCDVLVSNNLRNCHEVLLNFVKNNGFDVSRLNIITALIWLNMSPLHEYPINNFLFHFGKYNLWRVLNGMHI